MFLGKWSNLPEALEKTTGMTSALENSKMAGKVLLSTEEQDDNWEHLVTWESAVGPRVLHLPVTAM